MKSKVDMSHMWGEGMSAPPESPASDINICASSLPLRVVCKRQEVELVLTAKVRQRHVDT